MHAALPRSRALHVAQPILASALEKISGRIAVAEAARATLVEHMGGDAVLIPNGVHVGRYILDLYARHPRQYSAILALEHAFWR